MYRGLLRFVFATLAASCLLFLSSDARAFKIGYQGIPVVVADFPPVHEAVTAEAVRHFCDTEGLESLVASRLYRVLFTSSIGSCGAVSFNTSMSNWRTQMQTSPVANLLLGARYPDLREMAGVDADKQDVTVVKFDAEVQIDSYRLYPQLHGQLSKYHNIWGGDQALGLANLRSFTRAVLYEVAALVQSYDFANEPPPNFLVATNAMLDHDTNSNLNGAIHQVRWHDVLLGSLFHSLEDTFSHDPLFVLDAENERIVRGAVFYGRFLDGAGNTVEIPALYPTISPDLAGTMEALKGYAPIVKHSAIGPLVLRDVPQSSNGNANWFEHDGKRFVTGHMATTLAMYAVAEFLSLLHFAVEHGHTPHEVDARVEAYLDRWFTSDFTSVAGYTPTRTQDIAAIDPEYAQLPWYDYHFVDLWKQSNLADRTERGKQALILPWSDRHSMGDLLDDDSVDAHFVLVPSDTESFDPERRVFHVQKDTFYLFKSWYLGAEDQLVRRTLDPGSFLFEGKARAQEIELDSAGERGLDQVYASAFVPRGYRACFHAPANESGTAEPARTAAYDLRNEQYRCFYGTEEGRWVHVNFHLRKGTRVWLLPIDADHDGVPFVRGIADDVISDNCPNVANPEQADADDNGVGDVCDDGSGHGDGTPGDGDGQDGSSEDGSEGTADAGTPDADGNDEEGPKPPGSVASSAGGCSVGWHADSGAWLALVALTLTFRSRRRRARPRDL